MPRKITKVEFKDIITANKSICFCSIRKSVLIDIAMTEVLNKYSAEIELCDVRTAVERGKYITFSNGSNLDINDNKFNKYAMYEYNLPNGRVLASECQWYDTCDNEWYYQTLYYLILEG